MERSEFYASQVTLCEEGKKPNRAVEIVQVLLFTPDKKIILQKRSNDKAHNPGLIDKTIGGHVSFGDTPNYTSLVETLQEMQVPSIVLSSEEDFAKTLRLLKNFLNNSALLQFIDSRTTQFIKIIKQETVPIINKYDFYLGVYGGSIRPADHEASGILYYSFKNLQTELAEAPNLFTQDLRFFLDKYAKKIETFLSHIG